MFKKMMAILAVASVLFAGSVCAVEEIEGSSSGEAQKQPEKLVQAEVLEALGIYAADTTAEGLAKPVTRGAFIDAVIKMAYPGVNELAEGESAFSDVDETHPYYASITAAEKIGLISGLSYRRYGPDENIKTNHALGVVVKVLGYEVMGGYETAARLGLTKKFREEAGDELSEWNLIQLLYQALETDLMETNYNDQYQISKGVNLLNARLGIETVMDVVETNEYTGLRSAEESLPEHKIRIGGVIYETDIEHAADYLGILVKTYYKKESSSEFPEIVYMAEASSVSAELFEAENILGFSDNTYTVLNEEGDIERYEISSGSAVIYNQKADYVSSGMIPKDGTVELIDNDSDGRYDTVKLTEYETYFVKSVNHNDYSVLTQKGSLHFDKNVVCILDNKPAQWSNIGAAQIISVMQSRNTSGEKYTAVYASAKTVNGTVEEIGDDEAVISGTRYTLAESVALTVGASGNYCLDFRGRIAYINGPAQRESYGYLMGMDKKQGISGAVQLKLLTAAGSIQTFSMKEKVSLNGVRKTPEEIYEAVGNVPQLIKYQAGSENEIVSILTTAGDGLNEMEYNGTAAKFMYRSRSKAFGESKTADNKFVNGTPQYFLDSNTKVFFVSGDVSKEKYFQAGGLSSLKDGADYTVRAYDGNGLTPCGAIVIDNDSDSEYIYHYNYLFFVSSVSRGVDSDGNERFVLRGIFASNEVTYYVDPERYPDTEQIKSGDILQVEVSDSNELKVIKYVYRIAGEIPSSFSQSAVYLREIDGLRGSITDTALLVLGKITGRNGTIVEVEFKRGGVPERGLFDVSAGSYLIYERGKYKVMDDRSVPFETLENQLVLFHVRSGGTFEIALINH